MSRQHFLAADRIENPVGELDFDPEKAAVESMLALDGRRIDEVKAVSLFLFARADIRCYPRSGEPVDAFTHRIVILTGGAAIGEYEEIVAGNAQTLSDRLATLEFLHDLRDANRSGCPCRRSSQAL